MKILIVLIAVLSHCNSNQGLQENEPQMFRYEAVTRGSLYEVTITEDSLKVRSGLKGMDRAGRKITSEEWEQLLDVSGSFSLSEMDKFKSSGEKRFTDAAPAAMVEIKSPGGTYKSAEFDHGGAPKPLESLVKAILSLAETVE
ncbi:hypothetical protein E7Z59_03480 [Robertkochia marina]|uniref:Uncharacterized protein n=1 Tax=Robertkochia marina TaxID=1227945 RepID=A0A4S3M3C9_9FLAO|nr:hypothetical protein [Robertkochia marina]THD69400.1 hypothetical protein E7Z59_03480 [Robertkochia marina]TRZ47339.1 hypothetical protein D3A96_01100 [Robertkochia marina]